MESCDALVVGGGPAGSACARELRRGGLDVLVLDQRSFPRDKPCAGWVTPAIWGSLPFAPEEYGKGHVLEPVSGFRVGVLGRGSREVRYGRVVSFGVRRCEFDRELLARSGARFRGGERVATLRRAHGGWVVNDAVHARILVGAGGHFCPVARALGTTAERHVAVLAQEIEWRVDPGTRMRVEPGVPELYFSPDLRGYGWCFRKGTYLNVGLGRLDSEGLSGHVADFVERLRREERVPGDLPSRFRGHAYLVRPTSPRRPVDDAVVLVGDAAGLAYAESGEGIRPAIESGLLAGRTILEAAGDYRRERLSPYAERLRVRFGPQGAATKGFLPAFLTASVGRALLGSNWFTRRVVLDRWFLRASEGALAPRG